MDGAFSALYNTIHFATKIDNPMCKNPWTLLNGRGLRAATGNGVESAGNAWRVFRFAIADFHTPIWGIRFDSRARRDWNGYWGWRFYRDKGTFPISPRLSMYRITASRNMMPVSVQSASASEGKNRSH